MNNYVRKLFGVMFQSKQTRQVVRIQPQPLPTSSDEWHRYWQSRGFPWRTEPEIDAKRQAELSKCRAIVPDIEQGIYSFKSMKLNRADVEWLLATHDNGRGPVDWSDESQRTRRGLDLCGADLCMADLHDLPLARMIGNIAVTEGVEITAEQRKVAAVILREANLRKAHLEGTILYNVQMQGAFLEGAFLQQAKIRWARLEEVNLHTANLEDVDLRRTHLEGANLKLANLDRANLHGAFFDSGTKLTSLGSEKNGAIVKGVRWQNVDLTLVNWLQLPVLGDELFARQQTVKQQRLNAFQDAVRANRQLAAALQAQGLNEDAARFAYHAQVLQRKVLWMQRSVGRWLFSLLLALLAGYGYRLWRILAAYLLIILVCAIAYFILGIHHSPHLSFLQAFLESVTAFHGRVFSELFLPGTPQIWVTAFEAVAGLVIEGVFIAMLTQRFFGK